jgi:peptidoglycan/xylan/chitin deacetylase (PgdA/CDA1 family)
MHDLLAAVGTEPEGGQVIASSQHRNWWPLQRRLIDVGAHTVSHAQLSALPMDQQREEIGQSKTHLESILARSVALSPIHTGRDWITPARR